MSCKNIPISKSDFNIIKFDIESKNKEIRSNAKVKLIIQKKK